MGKKIKKVSLDVIILFVEGATEIEFYKSVLAHIRLKTTSNQLLESEDMKGVANFQRGALTHYKKIVQKYDKKAQKRKDVEISYNYHVFLCIDTDVFFFHTSPPLNKQKLESDLLKLGAKSVYYIEAHKSIEDWFLSDMTGIQSYLNLRKIAPGYSKEEKGADKLNQIFRQAGKAYTKGCKVEGFIDKLDIPMLMQKYHKELSPLYQVMGYQIKPSKTK